ncbi:MAG: bifunctional adenosylcobinamide kinase/adenosylcobinamide-phosphate guanylyltransferase [Mariprofundaceae bacterium]|nr:bifunctional adenosylcobinamide kinase/adenosylcobinamide-phosphate guanylyltransferase [Mariprofundaceae bacterium]
MLVHLVFGGAASGKSVFAEKLAAAASQKVCYIATAPHLDDLAWQDKIQKHQQRRPSYWQTIEAPLLLAQAIKSQQHNNTLILVDCVSLWLSNQLLANADVAKVSADLCQVLHHTDAHIILVSNEVGMGIVPEYALSRQFREAQGQLNQQLAQVADQVDMVIAGLPLHLKGE